MGRWVLDDLFHELVLLHDESVLVVGLEVVTHFLVQQTHVLLRLADSQHYPQEHFLLIVGLQHVCNKQVHSLEYIPQPRLQPLDIFIFPSLPWS